VSLFVVFENPKLHSRSLVMEYCPGGDLNSWIIARREQAGIYIPPERSMVWLGQIFLALEHLHSTPPGMLVRDVKPANIVLTEGGAIAKLTDFGMSCRGISSTGEFTLGPKSPPGTPHFVAPEVLTGCGYNYSADLYSLGVLSWVLLTGGLLSCQGTPRPPVGIFKTNHAEPCFKGLLNNWKMLKACVESPAKNDARPLPCPEAADFVLKLTNRGLDHQKPTHDDIRNHALMQHLRLPDYGTPLVDWLEHTCNETPPMPWRLNTAVADSLDLSGEWQMIDEKGNEFKYCWEHVQGTSVFKGVQLPQQFPLDGTIQGSTVEWRVEDVCAEGKLEMGLKLSRVLIPCRRMAKLWAISLVRRHR